MNKNQKGFTLLEALVGIFLVSILGVGIIIITNSVRQNQSSLWKNYISVDHANASITPIIREIRTAREAQNGSFAIQLADDNELIFYSDYDYDGETERIRYFKEDSNLQRGVIEPTTTQPIEYRLEDEVVKTITENLRNTAEPIFYYFNDNWPTDTTSNPLTTPASTTSVSMVRIYLRINSEELDPNSDYILESYSHFRVLKDNL